MNTDESVYLDHNATTPARVEAIDAMVVALGLEGNPSSSHAAGRKARATMETARDHVAAAVGALASEVIFTSGGTEANGATLIGTGATSLLISAIEHDSVMSGAAATGLPVHSIPVDDQGVIQLEALDDILSRVDEGALVCVMLANNETGVIQPIREIVEIARRHKAKVHCDAVQALAKIDVNFGNLGVDYMSVSAHKIGGPKGVGALIMREGLQIAPLVTGGGQEKGRRSGTENLSGIAGFGAAASLVRGNLEHAEKLSTLRDGMDSKIRAHAPDTIIFSDQAPRLPNTSNISMPGVTNELQLMSFDLQGLYVSAGSACSSGKVSASHVLTAMGLTDAVAGNSIRISLGWPTQASDVDRFVEAWVGIYDKQTAKAAQ
jgi:cysteine desulfurase